MTSEAVFSFYTILLRMLPKMFSVPKDARSLKVKVEEKLSQNL